MSDFEVQSHIRCTHTTQTNGLQQRRQKQTAEQRKGNVRDRGWASTKDSKNGNDTWRRQREYGRIRGPVRVQCIKMHLYCMCTMFAALSFFSQKRHCCFSPCLVFLPAWSPLSWCANNTEWFYFVVTLDQSLDWPDASDVASSLVFVHVCDIKREEGKNDNVFSLKRQGLAVLYMYFACLLLCTCVLVCWTQSGLSDWAINKRLVQTVRLVDAAYSLPNITIRKNIFKEHCDVSS